MKRIISILGVLFLICEFAFSQSFKCYRFKFYQLVRVDTPPKIDGVLNEAIWHTVKKEDNFRCLPTNVLATEQTFFCILYDEKNLYFGIECRESNPEKLVAKHTSHDDKVWEDDCVEIFIDTNCDRSTYYHFIVNSLGTMYEEDTTRGKFWDVPWKAKTSIGKKSWFVEISIPFSSLKMKPNKSAIWGLNVTREHYAGGKIEYSCWSYTKRSFHQPEQFGNLIWDPLTCLKETILPSYKKRYQKERETLIKMINPENKELFTKFNNLSRRLVKTIESAYSKNSISIEELANFCKNVEGLLDKFHNLQQETTPSVELWLYE